MLLVTVSDDRFGRKDGKYAVTQKKIQRIFENNPSFGISKFLMMDWGQIEASQFYRSNQTLLNNIDAARNGRVYKPYAISEGLKSIEEGEYLVYTDCSPEMWDMEYNFSIPKEYSLDKLKENCDLNGGILTAVVKWDTRNIPVDGMGIHTHENFTTDRCMRRMSLDHFSKCYMHASGMIVLRKCKKSIEFVNEWLYWNCIDECASLGFAHIENDYSFWNTEDGIKMGHRHDQSISGLLINKMGNKLIDIVHQTGISTYNFLNFCRTDHNYTFIDPNIEDTQKRIKKGDKVRNEKGQELTVFEIRPENGIEWLIVGLHQESCYRTTERQIEVL